MRLSRRVTDIIVGAGIIIVVAALIAVMVRWVATHPQPITGDAVSAQPSHSSGPTDGTPPPTNQTTPPSATPSTPPPSSATPPPTATPTSSSPAPPTTSSPANPPLVAVDCAKVACVALTFDDGPGLYTDRLLDILAAKNTPATFFLVGNMVVSRPGVVARMQQDGHAIGNHSYSHPHFKGRSVSWITSQMQRTNDAIVDAGGGQPQLMRPPYGEHNSAITKAETDLGLMQVLWNVDPEDWKDRNTSLIVQRAVSAATAGSIILLHDLYPTTVEAVSQIIDQLRAKGFTLVTVPQLVGGDITPGHSVSQGPHPGR